MITEVRASHILVKSEKEALDLKKKLKEGEKFAKLAKRFSTCDSKDDGGDLGFFGRGKMAEAFEAAAFKAQPNTIAGPVKTEFGWHLIQVTERREEPDAEA